MHAFDVMAHLTAAPGAGIDRGQIRRFRRASAALN
jgi:hypothetical protein